MVNATTEDLSGSQASGDPLLGDPGGLLTLRVRSPEHYGRILRIRSPKCVIGSHPSCTLRLRSIGVRPFHCLILRGMEGIFVRRWSPDTCLNGAAFTDARLKPGDCLTIGPIELEVLDASQEDSAAAPLAAMSATPAVATCPVPSAPLPETPSQKAPSQELEMLSSAAHPSQPSRLSGASSQEIAGALGAEAACNPPGAVLEAELTRQRRRCEQERGELTQVCAELVHELEEAKELQRDLQADAELQTHRLRTTSSDYQHTIDELRQDFAALKTHHAEQLEEQSRLVAQASEAEQRAAMLETQLLELRQQLDTVHGEAVRSGQEFSAQLAERDAELVSVRADMQSERQNWQIQHDDLEASRQQLGVQLEHVRRELAEAMTQLKVAGQQAVEFEQQLQELKRREEQTASHTQLTQHAQHLEEELAAVQRALEEQRELTRQEHTRFEAAAAGLRSESQQAQEQRRQVSEELAAAVSKIHELELQMATVAEPSAAHELVRQDAQRQRDEHVAEISKWKDVVDSLRQELLQERERHQCVRTEWHADRESLQRELSARSTALEELHQKHNQEMQEAEFLIHSLQQEGKQLLAQLDEAKQVIRHDIEKRKRLETSPLENPSVQDEAPSRCPTMPMATRLMADVRADIETAAERRSELSARGGDRPVSDARPSGGDANHTIMMSADEFAWHDLAPPTSTSGEHQGLDESVEVAGCGDAEASHELPSDDVVSSTSQASGPEPTETVPVAEADLVELAMVELAETVRSDLEREPTAGVSDSTPPLSPLEQAASLLSAAAGGPESDDHDGVIQRYMERLLKRVATQGRDGVDELHAVQRKPSVPVASPVNRDTAEVTVPDEDMGIRAVSAGDVETTGVNRTSEPLADTTVSGRPPAPEMAADLLAMRELANQTARQAIHSSDQRRFLTVAVGELFVAIVCLASSCLVIGMSPKTLNSQLIGGAIGLSFGLSMFVRGSGKLLNTLRLSRMRPAEPEPHAPSDL